MNAKEKRFIKYIRRKCKEHGVKCDLRKTKYVTLTDNIKCSGYFDETEPALVVAMNRPDWLQILAHEYCHLTQWVDGCKEWVDGCEGLVEVDAWLQGKRVRNIKRYLGYSRDLELDNEKRTVELLKKWEFDLNIGEYIQKANAYVMFYNYIYYTRRWSSPTNSPYTNKQIISKMSKKFNMKYKQMSPKYIKLFESEKI
jgi:hypothetical protein